MIFDDLPEERKEECCHQFLTYLYYFHRNPMKCTKHSYIQLHSLMKLLVNYTPSVYRDKLMVDYYQTVCLDCGTIHKSIVTQVPFVDGCHECASTPPDKAGVRRLIRHIEVSDTTVNPCFSFFLSLPVSMQVMIHEKLLDKGTNSVYNSSKLERIK